MTACATLSKPPPRVVVRFGGPLTRWTHVVATSASTMYPNWECQIHGRLIEPWCMACDWTAAWG